MANPSYYFTLFKKFQALGHVSTNAVHGSGTPSGGFNLKNPLAAFGSSNRGALLGATPAASPLWAVLNAKATGAPNVTIGGTTWPAMPQFVQPPWTDFQVNAPAPKLVQVFSDWITAGKVDDVPDSPGGGVLGTVPGPIGGALDPGIALFACSVAGDNGVRPGTVPSNFWDTSLIFLVDPATGNTVTPSSLAGTSEYYLTAVIGNRGTAAGGQYMSPSAAKIEAAAWAMAWNSGMGPAVQLPALSNLDVTSTNGVYEVYFLPSGRYEVVGFRINVQTVFDGLVKAVGASGMNLGMLTPTQWVHAQGAHLCVKVLVRTVNEAWPLVGDTPFTNRRLAQKNLAPFVFDLAVSNPNPNIVWKNFVVGDVFKFMRAERHSDDRWGRHRLTLKTTLPSGMVRLYLAIPRESFARWFNDGGIEGMKRIDEEALHGLKAPFPEHVLLALPEKGGSVEIPPLGEEFLAMSLGIEYDVKRFKPGAQGDITVVQETAAPRIDRKKQCYEIEFLTVGGFTFNVEAYDSRGVPKLAKP